jgi:hypothetical protein
MAVSFIGWKSGVPRENHWPAVSHWQTLSHNVVSSTPRLSGFELTTLVVICTDCKGSYKSNYHTITNAPIFNNIYFYPPAIAGGGGYRNSDRLFAVTLSCLRDNLGIVAKCDSFFQTKIASFGRWVVFSYLVSKKTQIAHWDLSINL